MPLMQVAFGALERRGKCKVAEPKWNAITTEAHCKASCAYTVNLAGYVYQHSLACLFVCM